MSERRAFPRIKKSLEVRFAFNGARQLGVTSDVSVTGLYILANEVPAVGEKLVVEVKAANGELLHLTGRVASSEAGASRSGTSGAGFAFALEAYNEAYDRLVSSVSIRSGGFPRPRRRAESAGAAASAPAVAAAEPLAAPVPYAEAVRILLVDPSERSHERLRDAVSHVSGAFTLEWVSTARDGLAALEEKRHDVGIVSWRLGSGSSGIELIRNAIAAGCETPLVLLTNVHDRELELEALREGAAETLDVARLDSDRLERAVLHSLTRARVSRRHSDPELTDLYENAPCGYMTLDANGLIVRMNGTALSWLGYARSELVGVRRFTDLLEPGSVPGYHERLRWFLERGRLRDLELDLRRQDGSTLSIAARGVPTTTPGQTPHSRWTFVDVSERHERETALRRLAKVVDAMQLGVTIKDLFGTLLYVNPARAAMNGYSVDELVGNEADVLVPEDQRREVGEEHLAGEKSWRRESMSVRKDGSLFPVRLVSDLVVDDYGTPLWIVTCAEDRSLEEQARQELDQAVRLTRERLTQQMRDAEATAASLHELLKGRARD